MSYLSFKTCISRCVNEPIIDSSVFLEANSFTSTTMTVATTYSNPVDTVAVKGCNSALVTFTLPKSPVNDTTITYSLEGSTAVNGQDYVQLSGNVTIKKGQTTATINITPLDPGIT